MIGIKNNGFCDSTEHFSNKSKMTFLLVALLFDILKLRVLGADTSCNYVVYGGNWMYYYPPNICWTTKYDSRQSELSTSVIWKCSNDGLNITYYWYNSSYDCTGESKIIQHFYKPKYTNFECNADYDCSIVVRKYSSTKRTHIIYSERSYVSSICQYPMAVSSSGYWMCNNSIVLEYYWAYEQGCNFADTNSYQLTATYVSDNTTIPTCNMIPSV
eukprot:57911_1